VGSEDYAASNNLWMYGSPKLRSSFAVAMSITLLADVSMLLPKSGSIDIHRFSIFMQLVEILTFLDRLSLEQRGRRLEAIERDILAIAWENRPYRDVVGYHEQTIKNKALLLWQYLSQLLNTKVNKRNLREILESRNFGGIFSPTSNLATTVDRVSAPQGGREPLLQGRQVELFQLQQWIEVDRCKLVFIYGMKGIGKSYVAQQIAKILSANLDYLVWIPLEKPVPLMDLLSIAIRRIGGGRSSKLSDDLSTAIDKTIGYLQKNRCLLILENADIVLGNRSGITDEIDRLIEEYTIFFNRLNSVEHSSCCLTILEEEVGKLDTDYRQLQIEGLDWQSCQKILENGELKGSSTDWEILVEKYHGNLQYLKSIVQTIQNIFGGSISKFLDANILVYDRIERSIADSIDKLSEQEMSVIIYLANHDRGITLDRLRDVFCAQIEYRDLLKVIDKLTRKYLIELRIDRFVLSELVAEYSIGKFQDPKIDRGNDAYVSIRITSNG
jgi:NB-ARC domain